MPATNVLEYERIWCDGMNRGDVSAADAVFAKDCVVHLTGVAEPIRGLEAWKAAVSGFLSAFPDLHIEIEEQFVSGDRVATRWHGRGTHAGALGPIQPTGRPIAISGLIFDHLRDGMVVERWEQLDQSLLLQQIGVA